MIAVIYVAAIKIFNFQLYSGFHILRDRDYEIKNRQLFLRLLAIDRW